MTNVKDVLHKKSGTSLNNLSSKLREHGRHAMLFSSPEPLGSQGELIVYQWSGVRRPSVVVVVHNAQTSSSRKPLGRSKPNFMWSLLGKGERKFI